MRLKASKRTIGLLCGGVGLVVAAFGAGGYFMNEELSAKMKIVDQKKSEVDSGETIAKRQEQVRLMLEEDRQRIQFLETGVTDTTYVPTMLEQLEDLATSTQNKVQAVRPQLIVEAPTKLEQRRNPEAQEKGGEAKDGQKEEKKKVDPYIRLGIQVSLVGTFQSTQTFIERLKRFPKIVAVEQIQVRPHRSADADKTDSTELDVEITLTAFLMKEGAPKPAVTASAAAVEAGVTQP